MRNESNCVMRFGRLFHQWLVDLYCTMETCRLNFLRHHQSQLRMHTYQGVVDQIRAGDGDLNDVGRQVILPSSYIGSPRDQFEQYHDAMAMVSEFGRPDLFITYTCNPNWVEITRELLPGQTSSDRPDIICRVFNMRCRAFLDEV